MTQAYYLKYPVAVREIQLSPFKQHQGFLELPGYQQLFVLYRFQGNLIGQALVDVYDGRISYGELYQRAPQMAWLAWQQTVAPVDQPPLVLPTASVVVCTRNRTDDLRQCLPELARLAEQDYEILVIDNCPSDDSTERLVAQYPRIRYVYEPRPGLDIARNRGLQTAQGEIVAFTDDDAQVDPGWLLALLRNFDDPIVGAVAGLTLPLELETYAQCWFEHTNGFGRGFTRFECDLNNFDPLTAGRIGAGVNMAIRRGVLSEVGLFDEALDGGTLALSGGDQEFFYRVLARGFRMVYEPKAVVWHKHRRDWDNLRQTLHGYGVGVFAWWTRALLAEKEYSLLFKAPLWFLKHHVRGLIRSLAGRPGAAPLDLAWAEFTGALKGPWRYFAARRKLRRNKLPDANTVQSTPVLAQQSTSV